MLGKFRSGSEWSIDKGRLFFASDLKVGRVYCGGKAKRPEGLTFSVRLSMGAV